jgi:hypothetical protein
MHQHAPTFLVGSIMAWLNHGMTDSLNPAFALLRPYQKVSIVDVRGLDPGSHFSFADHGKSKRQARSYAQLFLATPLTRSKESSNG